MNEFYKYDKNCRFCVEGTEHTVKEHIQFITSRQKNTCTLCPKILDDYESKFGLCRKHIDEVNGLIKIE